MEQVSYSLPASNIFVLNGQTVLFQNDSLNTQDLNGDILQEDLLNKESSPKPLSTEVGVQENTYEGGGYVIVKEAQKENECSLIQLTVQEAADLGIQFAVDNTPKNNSVIEVPSAKNQNIIFQKIGDPLTDKINETNTNTVNFITSESLNDITKVPFVSKNLNEFAFVPQYVNGQIAYAVQLADSDQVHTAQNIGIPISVPTMEVQSVSPAENDLNKLFTPVTVKAVTTTNNKVNKKSDTSKSATSIQTYVPNPKVRILSKVKHQELRKTNQRKIMPTGSDKYIVNRQRKLAPQKILLPPLSAKNGKDLSNSDSKILRTNVDLPDSIKQNVSVEQINQPTLKVVKENMETNEKSSSETATKSTTITTVNDNIPSTPPTVEELQVFSVPQGSQISKNVISVSNDKSRRKLTHSQLMQIAAVLQKNRLGKPETSDSSTLYDLETNTRIICRVLYPEDFTPEVEKTSVVTNGRKRGRPNKKEQEIGKEETKGKSDKERVPARTRSGRVTRPPRHMVEDYKRLKGDDSEETYSDYQSGTDENIENSPAVNLLPGLNPHQKRNFSSQFRCPTCNKIYLGRVRMALHYNKYPDHCDSKQLEMLKETTNGNEDFESGGGEVGKSNWRKSLVSSKGKGKSQKKLLGRLTLDKVLDSYNENEVIRTCGRKVASMLSTWEMLLLRLENKDHQGKCKVQAFLDELESFAKSVKAISQQILRPPNCDQPDIHLNDDTVSSLLGIEKGWYTSDDSGLPSSPLVKEKIITENKQTNQRSSDEDCSTTNNTTHIAESFLCKDEQDVVKVKEELSELDLLCVQEDPVVVDSVDQIVSERLKTMAPVDELVSTLPAMPATSADELVRGLLTDDLINSLETFIPPTHPSPDLDFTVLSTDFTTSR